MYALPGRKTEVNGTLVVSTGSTTGCKVKYSHPRKPRFCIDKIKTGLYNEID
jgi:hypothetical protein